MREILHSIIARAAREVVSVNGPDRLPEFELVLPALLLSMQQDLSPRPQHIEGRPGLAIADVSQPNDRTALTVFIVAELAQAALLANRDDPEALERAARNLIWFVPELGLIECAKSAVRAAVGTSL